MLKRLQNWYQLHCNGDWEHSYGVEIDTLDNPGWKLSVDLTDTLLEDVEFEPVKVESFEDNFWIDCQKVNNKFIGIGSADSLNKILSIFLDWADNNSDTSKWDEDVNVMIEQIMKSANLDQLRQLYRSIDLIPDEHTKKKNLIELFDKKWKLLINDTE